MSALRARYDMQVITLDQSYDALSAVGIVLFYF